MRSTARKRRSFMTLHRWIFVIVAALLVIGTAFGIYYREVQTATWAATNEAKTKAIEAAQLQSVETVYTHVWNKKSWIVKGIDQDNQNVFVWIADDMEPKIIKEADSISMQALKDSFHSSKPDAAIKRIQPGLLDDEPVWEIYYSTGERPKHYFYDFYAFDSGSFINSYHLPAKTEP